MEKLAASNKQDIQSEEDVHRILENAEPDQLKKVQEFYGLTPEQVKMFSQFARLRKEVHTQMNVEIQARKQTRPLPSQEELDMGAYQEAIEPQVRKAVLDMRRKGYNTFESGFYGIEGFQRIGCWKGGRLDDVHLPESLKENLHEKGMQVDVYPNAIEIHFYKYIDLDEIENTWNTIVNFIPDRGRSSEPSRIPLAERFRERFQEAPKP